MPFYKHKLLVTSLIGVTIVGSLAVGIAIGRSPELLSLSPQDSKQETREAILDKLENTAQQQAQAQASLFDPFAQASLGSDPFQQMRSQMEQVFGSLGAGITPFSFGGAGLGGGFANAAQPTIDVEETNDEYRVVISLAKDSDMQLETELEDNTLSISAKVRTEVHDNSNGRALSSTSVSQFSRAIPLGKPVNATGLQTEKSESEVVIRIPKLS